MAFKFIERREKLKHIKRLIEPVEEKPKISEEESDIRYSIVIDDSLPIISDWDIMELEYSFSETINLCLNRKKMSNVEFYKKAQIDRKLFSNMFAKKDYTPKKETAVACCLALEMELSEAQRLLGTAGYVLSDSKRWDVIIKKCIESKYYDIDDVNYILNHFGEKTL